MCQLWFSDMNLYTDESRHASHSCSKTATFYLCILLIWLRRYIFKLSFDIIHALIGFVIAEKTIWSRQETHISPILLPSEAFWLQAIKVFPAARVTLHKHGCVRLEEREEELRVLRFCLLEQNKSDSWFAETAVVFFSFICLTANHWTSCNTHDSSPCSAITHMLWLQIQVSDQPPPQNFSAGICL